MKSLTLLVFAGLMSIRAAAQTQAPTIFWQQSFGGSSMDMAASVRQTTDGGYITAGSSMSAGDISGNHGGFDYYIIKTDSAGSIVWQRMYGGSRDDYATAVQQTSDGGYIVSGYSNSSDGDVQGNHNNSFDYWILKLNAAGYIQWQHSLGGSGDDYARAIVQTTDGGYIVAGSSASADGDVLSNSGRSDYWIVKLDNSGEMQWQQVLGGTGDDIATAVVQAADGGYAVAGYTDSDDGNISGNHGTTDYLVIKLDAYGNLVWSMPYGGSGDDRATALVTTNDGGYVVAGYTNSLDGQAVSGHGAAYDYWVIRLSGTGTLLWSKTYGGSADDYAAALYPLDAGFVVAGYAASADGEVTGAHGGFDYWIVQLDAGGQMQWELALGGSGDDRATSIQKVNAGFIVAGYTSSSDGDVTMNYGVPGTYDYWLVRLMSPTEAGVASVSAAGYMLYPNPSRGTVNISVPASGTYRIIFTDMAGRSILSREFSSTCSINTGALDNGIYFYRISGKTGVIGTGKLVLQ